MAKDRGDRPARAGEFVAELRAALEPAPGAGAWGGEAGDRLAAGGVSVTATVVGKTSLVERPANNLPQAVTSFVGRRQEIAELHEALAEARLLTLAGPGGIGKTRLALEVAAGMLVEYRDGVWFV